MKVLLVDDHGPTLRLQARLFERDGWETAVAEDASSARAVIGDFAPDLVLLDLSLPDEDGLEILIRLRLEHHCHVLVLSGFERDRLWPVVEELGATDYVQKGADPDEILAVARDVVQRDIPALRYIEALRQRTLELI